MKEKHCKAHFFLVKYVTKLNRKEVYYLEIKGEVTEIIYQNEVNSYTVAEFETEEGDTTIVGYLPFINVGDTLKLIRKNSNTSRLW